MSRRLPALLGHELPGQVAKAGRNCDLHAPPDYVAALIAEGVALN
jgi:hydroxymethylglutaryl-CoA lyase